MRNKLYTLLEERLNGKEYAEIKISELETIAGEDWLMEVSEQAAKLNAVAELHPKDRLVVLVARSIN
ncbi:hypothetical protein [Pusillimonas sp. ANT_WB101]|uniref:hypothetical protein n=1 Tax=Pusillimonas sp. ANT_WB101 TaxID=2597356 RepID=UPI0011EE0A63|nr:hypothetical protein [Pusillimonas sp. ANT_WB101]KAA0890808.1 hypothetical protein FQ179_14205 [Pusillimonas sp. ANT_WB101]